MDYSENHKEGNAGSFGNAGNLGNFGKEGNSPPFFFSFSLVAYLIYLKMVSVGSPVIGSCVNENILKKS